MSTITSDANTSELKLPASLGPTLAAALMNGKPVSLAYTDETGKPHISFRGSVQQFSDGQLAFWQREPHSGVAVAIAANPHLALLYGDLNPETRAVLTFTGRARIDA